MKEMDANLQVVSETCAVCNDAGIFSDGCSFRETGLPTEGAVMVLAKKLGILDKEVKRESPLLKAFVCLFD
ncbi:Calcium-transporting ATPase [Handroanthus impetiginosus]|uniref:Calcium-transporting ATPase n=1 Tax=Handroanthus impetiginosus TaxID=429701 RepID=A0A2G9I4U2_9LAMI|nr:Calcium-transporting ATPase [Handroanthus impetiginosus]